MSLAWIFAVLLRHRRVVAAFALAGAVIAAIIGIARPATFTSSFTFLPQAAMEQGRGGLASLAGQFGIPIGMIGGGNQPPELYAELVETREILLRVVRDSFPVTADGPAVPVARFLEVKGSTPGVVEERAIRELRDDVISPSVASRTSGAVTVRVRTRSPHVSLGIASALLRHLNEFNTSTRQSQAASERRFTEGRLAAARAELRSVENDLQQFLQRNRQWQNSPQLVFEHDRLEREVSLQQQVVSGLAQQYEDARIREVRDTPVITVLEQPALPALADSRGRVRLLLVLVFVFGALGIAVVLGYAGWERQRELDPGDDGRVMLDAEWRRLRGTSRQA